LRALAAALMRPVQPATSPPKTCSICCTGWAFRPGSIWRRWSKPDNGFVPGWVEVQPPGRVMRWPGRPVVVRCRLRFESAPRAHRAGTALTLSLDMSTRSVRAGLSGLRPHTRSDCALERDERGRKALGLDGAWAHLAGLRVIAVGWLQRPGHCDRPFGCCASLRASHCQSNAHRFAPALDPNLD